MMDDEEIRQMDEFAENFAMLLLWIALGLVAVAFVGWAYFKLTGPAL